MNGSFTPRLEVLPPAQRRFWPELAAVPIIRGLPKTIKDRLANAAREVDLDSLPSMTGVQPGSLCSR